VVYLSAYQKSKNKELYPELIVLDNALNSCSNGMPFEAYMGVSPKRFSYVYDLDNKLWKKDKSDKLPPLLKCEIPNYYKEKEKDVTCYLKGNTKRFPHLKDLFE
jgi:hypothetical protein